ncbi:MAG: hypothetical protein UT66_C0021G0005 [candidate division CPR2 bacterium GW2011_GWC1_39_9]|uniref:DUF4446 domain-containing protein n=1 Tax=candidate division CPR2 bacterium GW2011_GWC2_39_10 TaxID=1618345 RepID=A0A0G0PXP7_UNCC2|nr:MAG: hypothetical protein UT18_C0012G0013 [candidate division CPR2 bacterium GW2011_GWC2_39_10]KKR34545.1 MAG: hypothetical protein UT66_C0021G0005 [candidate division CPR2 bacterium GW2011_GWC1_39_9]
MTETNLVIFFGAITFGLLAWTAYLQITVKNIVSRSKRLFSEVKNGDVVTILNETLKELDSINKKYADLEKRHKLTSKIANSGFYKLGLLRFNPFNDTGGDQSFSLTLLNTENDGFVVTSIHGRDGDRIYAKPISGGDSKYNLADEEKEAIILATKEKNKG